MKEITQEDVWGKFDNAHKMTDKGMLVARGLPPVDKYFAQNKKDELIKILPDKCPIWKDKLPYKSVTVVCKEEDYNQVVNWIHYVHGGDCIQKEKHLPEGKIAIRSNYMCW